MKQIIDLLIKSDVRLTVAQAGAMKAEVRKRS
jgi:hypothetical protein